MRFSVTFLFSHEGGRYSMTAALFWAITQRVVVPPYRRFGTTYRSQLSTWILESLIWHRLVVPKRGQRITTTRRVISQKNIIHIHLTAKACNQAKSILHVASELGVPQFTALTKLYFGIRYLDGKRVLACSINVGEEK
jgi:hypothetical protein